MVFSLLGKANDRSFVGQFCYLVVFEQRPVPCGSHIVASDTLMDD